MGINGLPKSNVIKFWLEDGSWVVIRPSGNEPKIKYYKNLWISDQGMYGNGFRPGPSM